MVSNKSEHRRLLSVSSGATIAPEKDLPPLPKPEADGNVPALEYARASLARKLIIERRARGWSQAKLARRAAVWVETINRLEKVRHTADPATAKKIQKALDASRPRSLVTRRTG